VDAQVTDGWAGSSSLASVNSGNTGEGSDTIKSGGIVSQNVPWTCDVKTHGLLCALVTISL